jgi:FtsH-binding integral membrane protein
MSIGGMGLLAFGSYWTLNQLLNQDVSLNTASSSSLTHIDDFTRSYLASTYKYVAGGLGITALTASIAYRRGMVLTMLRTNPMVYALGSLACTIGLQIATQTISAEQNPMLKHSLWSAYCGSIGALSLSPLAMLPSSILIQAGMYTGGIVAATSLIAMNARTEEYMWIGGPLMIGVGTLCVASIARAFFPMGARLGSAVDKFWLYGGLAVFSGLMVYETQVIRQHASMFHQLNAYGMRRSPDFINESIGVYLSIINIFIRMVSILGDRKK